MKAIFKTLFLVGLSSLQLFSTAQAQTTTTASVTSSSASSTVSATSSPVPTPPTFSNTPGLVVSSPFEGMAITQNTVLSISASLSGQRLIGTIKISVAKKDGTSNNTIVDITSGSFLRTSQTWNVTADQYPVGEYLMNMIITPNTTASLNTAPATTTAAPTTTIIPGPTIGPEASVYYWRATVRVVAPRNNTYPSSASGLMHENLNGRSLGMTAMLVTAGIAFFGSLLVF
ncbi:hypothetical protein B0O80DRAFT_464957 [Mortierella sp. GBAus27b]|nr:hypothetical protein BGX31_008730 [Mortierella sp. GBA43]KAI8347708.1 hypothetical protein B0O80DRAFT_464957 [Mortierella sp. GBAus27b]